MKKVLLSGVAIALILSVCVSIPVMAQTAATTTATATTTPTMTRAQQIEANIRAQAAAKQAAADKAAAETAAARQQTAAAAQAKIDADYQRTRELTQSTPALNTANATLEEAYRAYQENPNDPKALAAYEAANARVREVEKYQNMSYGEKIAAEQAGLDAAATDARLKSDTDRLTAAQKLDQYNAAQTTLEAAKAAAQKNPSDPKAQAALAAAQADFDYAGQLVVVNGPLVGASEGQASATEINKLGAQAKELAEAEVKVGAVSTKQAEVERALSEYEGAKNNLSNVKTCGVGHPCSLEETQAFNQAQYDFILAQQKLGQTGMVTGDVSGQITQASVDGLRDKMQAEVDSANKDLEQTKAQIVAGSAIKERDAAQAEAARLEAEILKNSPGAKDVDTALANAKYNYDSCMKSFPAERCAGFKQQAEKMEAMAAQLNQVAQREKAAQATIDAATKDLASVTSKSLTAQQQALQGAANVAKRSADMARAQAGMRSGAFWTALRGVDVGPGKYFVDEDVAGRAGQSTDVYQGSYRKALDLRDSAGAVVGTDVSNVLTDQYRGSAAAALDTGFTSKTPQPWQTRGARDIAGVGSDTYGGDLQLALGDTSSYIKDLQTKADADIAAATAALAKAEAEKTAQDKQADAAMANALKPLEDIKAAAAREVATAQAAEKVIQDSLDSLFAKCATPTGCTAAERKQIESLKGELAIVQANTDRAEANQAKVDAYVDAQVADIKSQTAVTEARNATDKAKKEAEAAIMAAAKDPTPENKAKEAAAKEALNKATAAQTAAEAARNTAAVTAAKTDLGLSAESQKAMDAAVAQAQTNYGVASGQKAAANEALAAAQKDLDDARATSATLADVQSGKITAAEAAAKVSGIATERDIREQTSIAIEEEAKETQRAARAAAAQAEADAQAKRMADAKAAADAKAERDRVLSGQAASDWVDDKLKGVTDWITGKTTSATKAVDSGISSAEESSADAAYKVIKGGG